MPTAKPDKRRVDLLQDRVLAVRESSLQDFYQDWLNHNKDARFRELAKRQGIPLDKVDRAREKNEAELATCVLQHLMPGSTC